jgi:hypothetical protein
LACAAALSCAAASAHDVITTKITWTQEISRIFYKRCSACHREGGGAPMPLTNYEQARPWAKAIRDEVLERRMPPWGAVKGFGDFRDDRSLSQPEIDLIVDWVEGGAPEGDPSYLPPLSEIEIPRDPPPPRGAPVRVGSSGHIASRPQTLVAIEAEGGTEAVALAPDGSVTPLLWTRNARRRVYWLREPFRLPRGARIVVTGAPLSLYFAGAPKPAHGKAHRLRPGQ